MFLVLIEFARVQTYLFAVPRMRAMLGANANLGETIRRSLVELARSCGAKGPDSRHALSELPCADPDDPLALGGDPIDRDDPQTLFRDFGILAREGGHFRVMFPTQAQADDFRHKSTEHIADVLPGLIARVAIRELERDEVEATNHAPATAILDLPVFQVCQETGNGPAATTSSKHKMIGTGAAARQSQGKRFAAGKTADIIGLLQLSGCIPQPEQPPEDIETLCNKDYLALIHADGNGIGMRYNRWCQSHTADESVPLVTGELNREIHGEHFFHSMRVAVRRALVRALNDTFSPEKADHFQLLMLGGDDLLIACRAKSALPFVTAYAEALQGHNLADGKPLTIGVGVAIAKPAYPFHRLHQLAEELADSAKRLYRSRPEVGSVVDWHVCTQSWADDPIAQRRGSNLQHYRTQGGEEHLVLTQRPYPVLGAAATGSLKSLREATETLIKAKPARSQLRSLVEALRRGRMSGELAWTELPDATEAALNQAGFADSPWYEAGTGNWRSPLPDLVEIMEIEHLGGNDATL